MLDWYFRVVAGRRGFYKEATKLMYLWTSCIGGNLFRSVPLKMLFLLGKWWKFYFIYFGLVFIAMAQVTKVSKNNYM